MITVILNCYKRPQYLEEQINAIKNQSIPPEDIWVWYNKPEDGVQYNLSGFGVKIATINHNFKFHGRFAFGLLARTEYVAFFDDDTIPGPDWFKNCMDTINLGYDGILGSVGVILNSDNYSNNTKVGWGYISNETPVNVDLVGHSWFMKKDYLRYLWYEDPISWENGEDIQLSYLAQKYGGVKTYVPPHPKNNTDIWGSLPDTGIKYGNDVNASWRNTSHSPIRNELVKTQLQRGWKLVRHK
jgi:glycosyltransferase involved in cell wall biosynthesis